jgi:hypothetical protein
MAVEVDLHRRRIGPTVRQAGFWVRSYSGLLSMDIRLCHDSLGHDPARHLTGDR